MHGAVDYDWQVDDHYLRTQATGPKAPLWLRKILGDEYFQEIVVVRIPEEPFPPPNFDHPGEEGDPTKFERAFDADQLACLDGLDRIESFELERGELKPEGLARLGRMSRLKDLTLITSPLDADGLAQIGRLSNLESLCLDLEPGPGTDLEFLDRLPKLKELQILGGSITETGLARIGRLERLELLSIEDGSKLTDASLSHLKESKKLRILKLKEAGTITVAALAPLEGLTKLQYLDLSGTPGDDELLVRLGNLPRLKMLSLAKGTIRDETIDELKTTKPKLKLDIHDKKQQD